MFVPINYSDFFKLVAAMKTVSKQSEKVWLFTDQTWVNLLLEIRNIKIFKTKQK